MSLWTDAKVLQSRTGFFAQSKTRDLFQKQILKKDEICYSRHYSYHCFDRLTTFQKTPFIHVLIPAHHLPPFGHASFSSSPDAQGTLLEWSAEALSLSRCTTGPLAAEPVALRLCLLGFSQHAKAYASCTLFCSARSTLLWLV